MTKMTKTLAVAAFLLVAMLGTAPSAHATVVSFNLTSNHCTVQADCGAPGTVFGVVTLNDGGGANVTITVDLNSPYVWAKTGSVDFMMFKFNATGVVAGDIVINSQPFGGLATVVGQAGAFNGDGTGTFGFGINCTSCGNGISTTGGDLVFTVNNATIAELTVPNELGNVFVADIGNPTNGATGPIDATTPNQAPEPATLTLVGLGVLGFGGLIRRRKN
jgi:hypothetical protein